MDEKNYLSVDEMMAIIENDNIKIVSFDLFDTLLVRPSVMPRDIFFLLRKRVREAYNLDFVDLRFLAEEQLESKNAKLEEIWSYIAQKNKISIDIANNLMQEEIDLELSMLKSREDIKKIYEKAVELRKRIIVISDMYMPSEVLMEALRRNGYNDIQKIYVSCECKSRKETGELFDYVIEQEGINDYSEIVHIGDNYVSDFQIPIKKGIVALYYPSIWDIMLAKNTSYGSFFDKNYISEDPMMRVLISFSLLQMYNKEFDSKKFFGGSLKGFSYIYYAPLLVSIACDMGTNKEVQEKYEILNFASRDGYFPKIVYDILFGDEKFIPSRYIYVSRQALSYVTFSDFFDYFDNMKIGNEEYLLETFINCNIVDENTKKAITSKLTSAEKRLDLATNPIGCRKVLCKFKKMLNIAFAQQKKYAMEYYADSFLPDINSNRQLIFDTGYSGSVSLGLSSALDNAIKIDKYYLWQTEDNKILDLNRGTDTFFFFDTNVPVGLNIILEECFSPIEGSCLGFKRENGKVIPYLDEIDADESMKKDMDEICTSSIAYVKKFQTQFGKYIDAFVVRDRSMFEKMGYQGLLLSEYMELNLFRNIKFRDSNICGLPFSLSSKVFNIFEREKYYIQPFAGTEFRNPEVQLKNRNVEFLTNSNIGIHIHLYNMFLYEEILCYLKEFPFQFDLIITVTEKENVPIISKVYNQRILQQVNNVYIKVVENRGRDVAPWIIATKEFQEKYDYFCHIHAKVSKQYDGEFGNRWRKYLFDNLIGETAAKAIIHSFELDDQLGCVFPQFYGELAQICITNNIPLIGVDGEEKIINQLLKNMHIEKKFDRSDMLWSAGTMLWYRPSALKPLFEIELTVEDFPEEPISVGGTIAHAIERLIGVVAKAQGYKVKIYNLDVAEKRLRERVVEPLEQGVYIHQELGVKGALRKWVYKKFPNSIGNFVCGVLGLNK